MCYLYSNDTKFGNFFCEVFVRPLCFLLSHPRSHSINTPFLEGLNPTGGDFTPFGPGYCTALARLFLGFDTIDAR
jgi:hypothetical protein